MVPTISRAPTPRPPLSARVRAARLAPALLSLALLAAACSSDGDGADGANGAAAGGTTETTSEDRTDADVDAEVDDEDSGTTAPAGEVEQFAGSIDEFYEVPDPLPAGEPGDLIRTMPLDAPEGEVGLRVMYHSTDVQGEDRAVTGVVFHPTAEPPEGGWPIMAWAHGTSGLASPCAPSRIPEVPPAFGVQGVRVATDYLGLGPVGELHPYLSAAAEGHAVIDGVVAARSLPEAGAGDQWGLAGVSQGGHAVLVTNEMAAERLPDADLVGAVAIAPGSELSESFGDDLQTRIITTLVLFGAAAEDPAIDPRDFLAPDVHDAAERAVEDGCVGDAVTALAPLAASPDYFTTDPRTDPVGSAWLDENDPGQVASDSPLLLVQGGQDIVVVPARTAALFERLCGIGQVVDQVDVPAADHGTVTPAAGDQIGTWLADRFAGEPATDDC